MNALEKSLTRRLTREKVFLYFSYIVNVAVLEVLIMVSTGIRNIINDSLNAHDFQQVVNILMSIMGVSAVTIFFFQWIISMQFRALYNSRNQFNTNLRLMGVKKRFLFQIYLKEIFAMQPISLLLGTLLGELIYFVLIPKLGITPLFIGVLPIISGCLLHVLVLLICVGATYHSLSKVNVINSMRARDDRGSGWQLNRTRLIVGLLTATGGGDYALFAAAERVDGSRLFLAVSNFSSPLG